MVIFIKYFINLFFVDGNVFKFTKLDESFSYDL